MCQDCRKDARGRGEVVRGVLLVRLDGGWEVRLGD